MCIRDRGVAVGELEDGDIVSYVRVGDSAIVYQDVYKRQDLLSNYARVFDHCSNIAAVPHGGA